MSVTVSPMLPADFLQALTSFFLLAILKAHSQQRVFFPSKKMTSFLLLNWLLQDNWRNYHANGRGLILSSLDCDKIRVEVNYHLLCNRGGKEGINSLGDFCLNISQIRMGKKDSVLEARTLIIHSHSAFKNETFLAKVRKRGKLKLSKICLRKCLWLEL